MNRRNFIFGMAALPLVGKPAEKQVKEPYIVPERVAAEPELPQYVFHSPVCWLWESPTYTIFKHDLE